MSQNSLEIITFMSKNRILFWIQTLKFSIIFAHIRSLYICVCVFMFTYKIDDFPEIYTFKHCNKSRVHRTVY